jgi:hypothetical protein
MSIAMVRKADATPGEVVSAFRKAAKDLDCLQSQQRFQDALFVIGRHKPAKQSGGLNRAKASPRRQI